MRIPFPLQGIDKGRATPDQPVLTSFDIKNMRPYDTLDSRLRGGQRPALRKRYSQQIGETDNPILAMCVVTILE